MNDIPRNQNTIREQRGQQAGPGTKDQTVTEVKAAELQVGDEFLVNDWHLHVRNIDVDGSSVAFVVDEFPEIVQHRAADAVLHVNAHERAATPNVPTCRPTHCA